MKGRLAALENLQLLPLARLPAESVTDVLRDLLKDDALARTLAPEIAKRSDGVPFFVFELVHGLEEEGVLERRGEGGYRQLRPLATLAVPPRLRELLTSRLAELSPDERAVLDSAAVQGTELDADLVAEALGRSLVGVLQDLARIERKHGLVGPAGRMHRFDHHLVHEVVVDELAPRLLEEYHALTGDALGRRLADGRTTVDWRTRWRHVHHHVHGSRPERAVDDLAPVARWLLSCRRHEAAAELLEAALARRGLVAGRARVELLLGLGTALDVLGRRQRQEQVAREAVLLSRSVADAALESRALRHAATTELQLERPDAALHAYHASRDRAGASGDELLVLQAEVALAQGLTRFGRPKEAQAWVDAALDRCERIDAPGPQSVALRLRGVARLHGGRYAEGAADLERSRELARKAGSVRDEGLAEGNLGIARWLQGDLERSRAHQLRALEIGLLCGEQRAEQVANGMLGLIAMEMGQPDEALRRFERQLEVVTAMGDGHDAVIAQLNRGATWSMLGQHEQARRDADEALRRAEGLGVARIQGLALSHAAGVAHARGDRAAARELRQRGLEKLREAGDRTTEVALAGDVAAAALEDAWAEGHEAPGDAATELAREALARARELGRDRLVNVSASVLACFPGQDAPALVAEALAAEKGTSPATRLLARRYLWKATGDVAHLAEAARLLDELRRHVPEVARESVVRDVKVHAEIVAAWEEHRRAAGLA